MDAKAAGPTEYRVATDTVQSPPTKLAVAPRVTLKLSADLTSLKGAVRPAMADVPVRIQQLTPSGRWTTVLRATQSKTGRFVFSPPFLHGVYRARIVPGHGWSSGISARVTVE
jgi:hypothetical protein